MSARWLIVAAIASSTACAGLPWARPTGCPVVPVASSQLPQDLWLRARMSFAAAGREIGLEAVARRTPEELVVIGLAPYGGRLFVVRQQGRELAVEAGASWQRHLGLWVLDVLHRVYWIEPPAGASSWAREGERVAESLQAGRLQRTFTDGDGSVARATIVYPGASRGIAGAAVEIRSVACGYQAVVVALETTPPEGANP